MQFKAVFIIKSNKNSKSYDCIVAYFDTEKQGLFSKKFTMVDNKDCKPIDLKDVVSYSISHEGEVFVLCKQQLLTFYTVDVYQEYLYCLNKIDL